MSDDRILEAFRRAAGDRSHGAAEIERQLISDLLEARGSWTPERLAKGAGLLTGGRTVMAPLIELADRISGGDVDGLAAHLEQRSAALDGMIRAMVAGAIPWIEKTARVVTISRSSAVAAAVEGAWRAGWHGTVVVLDGSSAGRGPEQAQRLGVHGPVVSQPDAAGPRWLDVPETLVAVGADAIAPERFVNCVGTRTLLELASARSVPVVLIADRGKDVSEAVIDAIAADPPLHRDDTGREWALFEVVPMTLVTARISD